MEKLCSIKGSKLYFNGEELLKIESIEKIEVKTLPVRQAIKSQLLNSMATFMSGSLINGNEQCIVGLNIIQKDKKEIWIPFHEGSPEDVFPPQRPYHKHTCIPTHIHHSSLETLPEPAPVSFSYSSGILRSSGSGQRLVPA